MATNSGTRDGSGAGDHDTAFAFGRKPSSKQPFPFTERQYGRLLCLRGRVQDGMIQDDNELVLSGTGHPVTQWQGIVYLG